MYKQEGKRLVMLGLAIGVSLLLSSCKRFAPQSSRFVIQNGCLDLRSWRPEQDGALTLAGEWDFFWEGFLNLEEIEARTARASMRFPGSWRGKQHGDSTLGGTGFATFHLRILLSPTHKRLGLRIPEFLSAYRLYAGSKLLCSVGEIGKTSETTLAQFSARVAVLPDSVSEVNLILHGANFAFFRGGMISPIKIDRLDEIRQGELWAARTAGILVGVLLLACVYHLRLYYFRRVEVYNLYLGLYAISLAAHTFWIHGRWMYDLLGPEFWGLNFRAEVSLWLASQLFVYLFLNSFFPRLLPKWTFRLLIGFIFSVLLLFLFGPIWLISSLESHSSFFLMCAGGCNILVLALAYRKRYPQSEMFFLLALLSSGFIVLDYLRNGVQVGEGLLYMHFGWALMVLAASVVASRRAAESFSQVALLTAHLKASNAALETQNQSLELEVKERTAQWVAAEKKNHELELEGKKRDLENLSFANMMIRKHRENTIAELKRIQKENKENLSGEIRRLILDTQAQSMSTDRIAALQQRIGTINEEFNERLRTAYPKLTKSERDLCVYIKLGMSTKDIAALKNSTAGTINVARHRLRKKLNLGRSDELQDIIQQI